MQDYYTKGFSIFSFIPVTLTDATGLKLSLTLTASADGKSLVPSTLTVPNISAPCAINWMPPPVILHPPINPIVH